MADRHLVTEYRLRDHAAARRAGIDSRRPDVHPDDDPFQQITPDPWPLPVDEDEMIAGRCPCGSLLRPNGVPEMVSCDWCGHRERVG